MQIIHGNSFEELDWLDENHFASVVTDPPYELTSIVKRFGKKGSAPAKFGQDGRYSRLSKGFMGHEWDGSGIQRNPEFWAKVLKVMKPGAFMLAFGGTRTFYRTACAIEDAGFIIFDTICWLYGQGFPKSHSLGDGWGTALKPAFEPIILAQRPISEKTIVDNVLKWGTGGINIDESRIETVDNLNGGAYSGGQRGNGDWKEKSGFKNDKLTGQFEQPKGRWPANVILDEETGQMLDEQSGTLKSGFMKADTHRNSEGGYHGDFPQDRVGARDTYGDSGGASRFFYCAKASKSEKTNGGKAHPTSKPIALMVYLIRLITPKGGIVLDPFLGGGSTALACMQLGYDFVGIEKEQEYYDLAMNRIKDANHS